MKNNLLYFSITLPLIIFVVLLVVNNVFGLDINNRIELKAESTNQTTQVFLEVLGDTFAREGSASIIFGNSTTMRIGETNAASTDIGYLMFNLSVVQDGTIVPSVTNLTPANKTFVSDSTPELTWANISYSAYKVTDAELGFICNEQSTIGNGTTHIRVYNRTQTSFNEWTLSYENTGLQVDKIINTTTRWGKNADADNNLTRMNVTIAVQNYRKQGRDNAQFALDTSAITGDPNMPILCDSFPTKEASNLTVVNSTYLNITVMNRSITYEGNVSTSADFSAIVHNFSGVSASDTTIKINVTTPLSEGIHFWRVRVNIENDTFSENATGNFTIDLTVPNLTVASPDNDSTFLIASLPLNLSLNITGLADNLAGVNECFHSLDGGTNVTWDCNTSTVVNGNTSLLVNTAGSHKLYVYVNDSTIPTPNLNTTVIDFTVTVAGGGGGTGGTSGGGGSAGNVTCGSTDLSWIVTDASGGERIDFSVRPEGKRSRELILKNTGLSKIDVLLSCQSVNSSKGVNACERVSIAQGEVSLEPSTFLETFLEFNFTSESSDEDGDEFNFNVVSVRKDKLVCSKASNIKVTISSLTGVIFKVKELRSITLFHKLNPEIPILTYSVGVIVLVVSLVLFFSIASLLNFVVFKELSDRNTRSFTIAFLTSLFLGIIILVFI